MISAIVLAAGEAKRFGSAKQLAVLNGKPLLQHTLDNLAASKVDDIVVVLGAYADEIRKRVDFGRARVVMNPDFAQGMSTSIHAGLRAIPHADRAMIVLADQPFVRTSTFDALIATAGTVVAPQYKGFRGNPVIVDRSLFDEMMEIRGDVGCRAIFGSHEVTKVIVDDAGVVQDIDTPLQDNVVEMPDLLETMVELRKKRQAFATATIVRAEKPTSAKPGDKAIIAPDGTLTGWIGGSCAHDIVVRNALEALAEGAPRFLRLASTFTDTKRHGVIDIPMQCYSGGVLDVFIEPSLPKPHMVVIGYETIARALVRISKTLDFYVTVIDPMANMPEADAVIHELKLPAVTGETFVVVATHGRYDEEALELAAKSGASYVALVASPKRAAVILDRVRERGVDVSRVKSPAGLDIGAQGAEEIALSIVAEIVQLRRSEKSTMAEEKKTEETEAIDPICNMTVEIATARYVSEYQGKKYYFCCAHCQRTFEKSHVA